MKQISPYAELMAKNAVTQAEIAKELGYSKQAVNSWFTGKVEPKLSLNDWNKLAKLFNTSIADLPLSFAPKVLEGNNASKV